MRKREVVMDGDTEFGSIRDAARRVCAEGGIEPTEQTLRTISGNIANVVGAVGAFGKPLTAYGHVWTELQPSLRTSVKGLEERCSKLEAVALDLWGMSRCLHSGGEWLDVLDRMRELGLEV